MTTKNKKIRNYIQEVPKEIHQYLAAVPDGLVRANLRAFIEYQQDIINRLRKKTGEV